MGQKIVITANMNNNTPRIARKDVVYQWHWHRIGTVAGVGAFAIGALWYAAFTPANAEQSRVSEVESATSQLVAEPVVSSESSAYKQPLVAESESESLVEAQAQNDAEPIEQVAAEVNLVQEVKAEPVEPVIAEPAPAEPVQVEPIQSESIRTETAEVEPSVVAADFNDEAKVANLAQGSKIDTDKVSRAVLTTQVQDREPVSALGREINMGDFDDSLVFFTELHGLQGQKVSHIWYFEEQQMARVELGVHTARYRTFSSKHIMPSQVGLWRVELRDNNNKLLATREFRLIAKP
ncbi:DUF2914 domain-containing protein [Pseudoalteromonas sp. T1lg88]|uniref:DUF2914 domain-containing protein n=1 Tax=Pseudoalteromonas sp. T1lg88 TaxID=2077104 RepID=UPI000CF63DA6|nr:DUF2914 domain-containing protein [Pseudoalteromonas sp. T1lg88]